MDIHKPKPWHSFREFLKEYLIIVVGVLTALGAEQAVEWLHWRDPPPRPGRICVRTLGSSWSTWPTGWKSRTVSTDVRCSCIRAF